MRHKFLTLLGILTLSSCLVQSPNELSSFDDGIYSWSPYPNQYFGYLNLEDAYSNSYARDDYNNGYEEDYFDAYNWKYSSSFISFRPTRKIWSYNRNSFFPSYYHGFNNPWNYGYSYSYGLNSNWNYGFNNPYGFNDPWSNRGFGYGYGFNNSWYGNTDDCFGCNNGWNNNTGWNNVDNSGNSGPEPVSSNISIRRLNLNSSSPARRPSITNKPNGGRVLDPKIAESRSDVQGIKINVGDLKIFNIKSESGLEKKFNSLLDLKKDIESNELNYNDRNVPNAKHRNKRFNNSGSLNTRPTNTRSSNTRSSNTGSSNTRSSNTRSSNTRSSNTGSSNTRSSNTRSSNTRSSNTRSSNTRSSNTRSSNTRSSNTGSSNTRSSTSKKGGK